MNCKDCKLTINQPYKIRHCSKCNEPLCFRCGMVEGMDGLEQPIILKGVGAIRTGSTKIDLIRCEECFGDQKNLRVRIWENNS